MCKADLDQIQRLVLTHQEHNQRLDAVIAARMEDVSRSRIQRFIAEGAVVLNGERILKGSQRVKDGDVVEIDFGVRIEQDEPQGITPQNIPVDIIHEDESIIIANKPAGMLVYPTGTQRNGTLVNALIAHSKNLSTMQGSLRPGIVHRLDKVTSGVMVIAKNNTAHYLLGEQFADRKVEKTYLALVCGNIRDDETIVDVPIGRNPANRTKLAVVPNGRSAETIVNVLERFEHLSYLQAKPRTGRTHQIRVHLQHIGCPIVGDNRYGWRKHAARESGEIKSILPLLDDWGGICLHAAEICFYHPDTKKWCCYSAPLSDRFAMIYAQLRQMKSQGGNRQ